MGKNDFHDKVRAINIFGNIIYTVGWCYPLCLVKMQLSLGGGAYFALSGLQLGKCDFHGEFGLFHLLWCNRKWDFILGELWAFSPFGEM